MGFMNDAPDFYASFTKKRLVLLVFGISSLFLPQVLDIKNVQDARTSLLINRLFFVSPFSVGNQFAGFLTWIDA
jgi:hypothetical protein